MDTQRVCVRCTISARRSDPGHPLVSTRWSNDADGGLTVACDHCGLTAGSPLTEAEAALVARIDQAPIKRRRLPYLAV